MIKFTVKIITSLILIMSSIVNASLITDSSLLTSDHYVTYSDEFVTIDFAWASPINVEYWGDPSLESSNQLFAPSLHQGWDYASQADIDILLTHFTLADFTIGTGDDRTFINAVQFWNSVFNDVVLRLDLDNNLDNGYEIVDFQNLENFENGLVRGEWTSSSIDGQGVGGTYYYDTFYVRKTRNSTPSTPIPEPASLLIFALGLIALSLRVRRAN